MRFLVICAVCCALAACAKSPESISAAYISDVSYRPLSCQDLAVESARVNEALARASTQQENARTNDVVGVLLIGVPVSSLSGDNIAPEIARYKGEQEAINRVVTQKHCSQ
ncbi:MAG: hypothetical protein J0I13_00135 [Rhizobiales bacterium]|nr:hypothetical protein [Hyphomicrobiales bacterium]